VVVDSSTCLDQGEAAAAGIIVVPLQLIIGGRGYRDAVDIARADSYRPARQPGRPHHLLTVGG
jgi:fatty acid-binding protein DegV